MDNIAYSPAKEGAASAFLQEWLEERKTNFALDESASLVIANIAGEQNISDKRQLSSKKEVQGGGKFQSTESDQVENLDKELKDFADKKLDDSSHSMSRFQKALVDFCKSSDKETAMDDLNDTYASILSRMNVGVEAIFQELKTERARQSGRKELESAYKKKQDQFYGKLIDLPYEESRRIEELLKKKEGESKDEQRKRVREGIAKNKPLLNAYNEMVSAEDAIETSKSAREKHLEHLSRQIYSEAKTMKAYVEKAYIRTTFKN